MRNISYHPMEQTHIAQAADLVLAAYKEERQALPFLPKGEDFTLVILEKLASLLTRGISLRAMSGDEMLGFMVGIEVAELWGGCKGFYSPLYGHGAKKDNRSRIYPGLYTHMAQLLVDKEIYSHALTFFAHDRETIETWLWLGFGGRCVDSIRQTLPLKLNSPGLEIRKLGAEDIPALADNQKTFQQYMGSSPLFMLPSQEDPTQEKIKWLANPNHHLWAAYHEGIPLGQMQIEPHGETFISAHPQVMNITGAYVRDDTRHTGAGSALLGAIQQWLQENGYPLCGVDFESFNVTGARFWNKYFTPYTLSLTRRIDERIKSVE